MVKTFNSIIKKMDYCDSVSQLCKIDDSKNALLSFEEEQELFKRLNTGDKISRDRLINCNQRLVISIAKRYYGYGVELLDLIQEGNIGLMKAIDRYDVDRGFKFSTYATWWIMEEIRKALVEQSRIIRIPGNIYEILGKYRALCAKYESVHGEKISTEKIANIMNITLKEVKELQNLDADVLSIDTQEKGFENQEVQLEELVFNKCLQDEVRKMLEKCKLKEKHKNILILRFGLDGGEPKTLEEIGILYNVTRESIRKLEKNALQKIRKVTIVDNFACYMDNPKQCLENLEKFRNSKTKGKK